ncbi:MAG: ribose-5-phosphate isomerase RpiA [Candidatus Anstonellales archaeon]
MKEKLIVAKEALKYVKNEMVVGLGSGSTAKLFIELLANKVKRQKLCIKCVPTSYDTEMFALECGLDVVPIAGVKKIDVAVDGADYVCKEYAIKGGGGALAREKVVGYFAEEFIIIVDSSKTRRRSKVPIEVLPFAYSTVMAELEKNKITTSLRMSKTKLGPVVTDNGNFILDAGMEIENAKESEKWLDSIPGVVANGIFTKFSKILVGEDSKVEIL